MTFGIFRNTGHHMCGSFFAIVTRQCQHVVQVCKHKASVITARFGEGSQFVPSFTYVNAFKL